MTFQEYNEDLFNDAPLEFYYILIGVFLMGIVVIVFFKGLRNGMMSIFQLLLLEYVMLLYCSTVFFRNVSDVRKFNLMPFWSYFEIIQKDSHNLVLDNTMNVLVFVPAGIITAIVFHGQGKWRIILGGCIMSVSIEVMQFLFKRGFAEFDDVFHNTLGCTIGVLVFCFLKKIFK